MYKNALFFEKSRKIAAALGLRPQTLVGPRRLRAPPLDPRVVTPITCCTYVFEGFYSLNVVAVKKEQK